MIVAKQITSGSVLAAPVGSNLAVVLISLCNFHPSSSIVDVNVVPSGSVAGNSNFFIKGRELSSNESLVLSTEKILLGSGDSIWMSSSLASSVSTIVSYMSI